MNRESILQEYVKDRRAMSFAGYTREDLGHLVRQTPCDGKGGGWVYFPDFKEQDSERIIQEQIAYFQSASLEFEWKMYDFDQPDSLHETLIRLGFLKGEPEHLMVFDLQNHPPIPVNVPSGIQIERAQSEADIQSIQHLQEEIWGKDLQWLFNYIKGNPKIFSCYKAMESGEVVGSGWTEYLPGSQFPELHGGGILPAHRKKGIYSALLATRFKEAISNGCRYLSVDAAPMSKPILERKGFVSLAVTWPYTMAS